VTVPDLHLGFASPLEVHRLAPWLDGTTTSADLPVGLGGPSPTTLLRELLRRGVQVTAVTLDRAVTEPVCLRGPHLTLHVGPFRPRHAGRDAFARERKFVRETLVNAKPDVVHGHWSYEFGLAAAAVGRPAMVTINDWCPRIARLAPRGARPYWTMRAAMQVRSLRGPAEQVAISPAIARRAERVHRHPVAVIPNGFEDELFTSAPAARAGPPFTIVAVNHGFTRWKNVATLLRAFSAIRRALPAARLVLLGQGFEPGGPAARWAGEAGLDACVELRGPQPRAGVLTALDEAHVFAHPALEEGFGLVLVEAMARRLAVVGGRASGGVPWVLDGGRAGVLADVSAPSQLAAAIIGLLRDTDRRTALAEAGWHSARARFGIVEVADRYLDRYHRLLPTGAGRACA
jgi:glycosyltransferase involved in cell wall biosynthesis